jgi:hypothetical protein
VDSGFLIAKPDTQLWYNPDMPAHDILHDVVKEALIKNGWIITHDPFTIAYGQRKVYADLGAERILAAEKANQKIVIEVKSFIGISKIADLEQAAGRYFIYKLWLSEVSPEYSLYLAIDLEAYNEVFLDISGRVLIDKGGIKLIVISKELREIQRWIS